MTYCWAAPSRGRRSIFLSRPRHCAVRTDQDRLARGHDRTELGADHRLQPRRHISPADAINAAGGVKGRKLEIITRDTQGDPTKAVNATQELISQAKVHAIWGPAQFRRGAGHHADHGARQDAGYSPLRRRHADRPSKFPNAFRMAPSNSQWDDAVRNYCLKILKVKKIAVIGDTTGYGVTAVESLGRGLQEGRRRRGLSAPMSTRPSPT